MPTEEYAYTTVDGTRNGWVGDAAETISLFNKIGSLHDPHGTIDNTTYIKRTPPSASNNEMKFTVDMSTITQAVSSTNIYTLYIDYSTGSTNHTLFNANAFQVVLYETVAGVDTARGTFNWEYIGGFENSASGSASGLLRFTGGIVSFANTIKIGLGAAQNGDGLASNEARYGFAHLGVLPGVIMKDRIQRGRIVPVPRA